MKRLAVPLVLAAVASSAGAAVSSAALLATRSGSSIQVTAPLSGPVVSASARTITAVGAASATVRDLIPIQGPAGSLVATSTRTVTAASVALGALELARKTAVPIAVGMALYDLYKGSGIRHGPDGALQVDPGTEPADVQETEYWISPAPRAASRALACENYRVWLEKNSGAMVYDPVYGSKLSIFQDKLDQFNRCQISRFNPFTGALIQDDYRIEGIAVQTVTKRKCGTGETRVDGLCVTGVWLDANQVPEQRQLSNLENATKTLGISDILTKVINAGQVVESTPVALTGPASQTGDSRTTNTTGPSGTVSTTVTPTYNYTYNGDTITYNTTNNTITTKTNTDGETTTETETETEPPDTKGLCDLFPSALACMKVGDIPEPDKLPENVKLVAPGRHSAWSYNSGQCPNRTIDFSFGVSVNILQPFCDFFVILKGVILSIFSLASALVFRGGIR